MIFSHHQPLCLSAIMPFWAVMYPLTVKLKLTIITIIYLFLSQGCLPCGVQVMVSNPDSDSRRISWSSSDDSTSICSHEAVGSRDNIFTSNQCSSTICGSLLVSYSDQPRIFVNLEKCFRFRLKIELILVLLD